ncbi:hypothetical protein KEJ45_00155 [Candidatus Bathyarchaeota archaeon]|nr:hypothetical protein [Candidatus Bathyarchaeota archaeon]
MAAFEGKCSRCGKTHLLKSLEDSVLCDCWQICPVCGAEMTPYMPDTTPRTYALDGHRELQTLMFCPRHAPPFFSKQKPVEVKPDA